MTKDPNKLDQNPLAGDENFEICVMRQVNRKVPASIANQICMTLSAALGSNALKDASDMVLVPAVFTAEGVHNGLYKPWESIANAAPTLVGVPFFINQTDEHVNGITPPVDDPMKHHGIVLTVNRDEKNRRLTGIIGLFKPDYLKAKGFTPARVKFQENLVNALKAGGRFAISVSYLARVIKRMGMHANRAFAFAEDKHVFNGVSIVPEGAEKTALMNGATEASSIDVLEGGFNADLEAASLSNASPPIESLNTPHEQSGSKAMDAEQLRSMSTSRLAEMNHEVAKLVNAHEKLQGEIQAANRKVIDLETQNKSLTKDSEKASEILANILDSDKAEEILANAEGVADLAEQVQEVQEKLANDLAERRQKDEDALKERVQKAKKALANRMKAEDLKAFEDPKDLGATAVRLEKLANSLGTKRIVPAVDVVDGLDFDLSNADEFDAEQEGEFEEALSNGEGDTNREYAALSNIFEATPKVAAAAGQATRKRGDA